MDKKITIAVLVLLGLLVFFLVVDANNKMNKLKKKEMQTSAPAPVTGTRPRDTASDYDPYLSRRKQKTQPAEMTYPQTGQNMQPNQSQYPGFEEIEPPELSQSDTQIKSSSNRPSEEMLNILNISELGVSRDLNSFSKKYSATDAQKNKYHFVPASSYTTQVEEGSLGILVKLSKDNKILWQTEIRKYSKEPYAVTNIESLNDRIKLYLSKDMEFLSAITLNSEGNIYYNPYPVRFSSNFSRMPNTYKLKLLKTFSVDNAEFAVVSYADLQKKVNTTYCKEEYYLYRIDEKSMNKIALLFDRLINIPNITSTLSNVSVSVEGTSVTISSDSDSKLTKSLSPEELTTPSKEITFAPNRITSGIAGYHTNYSINLTNK